MSGKKKVRKALVPALLAGTLAVTMAGCAQNNNGANGGNTLANANTNTGTNAAEGSNADNGAATTEQKPLDISIMLPIFKTNYPKDDSPVAAEIEKRTNANIHFEWVPNASYTDKFNITLASGKLPAIMYVPDVKSPSFVNAAKSGAFWELGPYLKDYTNLGGANPVILTNSSVDGKNYGLYRGRALGRNGVIFRQDWLANVGLSTPTTIDEFYNMLKAFKEKDPDKNGKDDTYGMVLVKWTGQWASGFDIMKLWFGSPNKWGVRDGKLVPEHLTSEYMEALKFMRKLYEEKLINSDFAVMDSAKWTDPIVNGNAGVIVDVVDNAARIDDKIHAALVKAGTDQPDIHFMDVIGAVNGTDGQLHTLPTSGFAGMLAVPKSTVKSEDELKRVLAFIDQMNEPEMQTLAGFGIEGKHYTKSGEAIEPSKDTVLLESEVEGLNQMLTFMPEDRSLKVKQTPLRIKQTELMKENEKTIVSNPAEPFISTVYSQKGAQLDNMINDARIKYIVGKIDEAGFQEAIEAWKKSGGDELIAEMNELYAASQK
ncbi:putative aldouronate transport system substrate-binding protein [Paenibacillus phyllosphaerae]|uniref:Putative aldouronate transport system substrate-binding protein n=1 Tax=Paenibacillus phyllosphaerae TaxID=274593 RepID=A0A7W5AZF9_9BACL|nr:extracellular solute-binding protein [Paenibacillus phyllosphaerae]MBB3111618.1 putative aldouronate transport system substrate-binding protein [Paenibacillus phyllosphaerae]